MELLLGFVPDAVHIYSAWSTLSYLLLICLFVLILPEHWTDHCDLKSTPVISSNFIREPEVIFSVSKSLDLFVLFCILYILCEGCFTDSLHWSCHFALSLWRICFKSKCQAILTQSKRSLDKYVIVFLKLNVHYSVHIIKVNSYTVKMVLPFVLFFYVDTT